MWKRLARTFSTPSESSQKTISRVHQNNRMPYWYSECETFYKTSAVPQNETRLDFGCYDFTG